MKDKNKISIEFTKRQYWDLLRSVYIADWIANAICEGDMKTDDKIKEVRDHIFSFAKEMGYEKYVEYDNKMKRFFPTLDLDDEPTVRSLIERYNEDTFWEELIDNLGDRDFYRKYSKEDWDKMTEEERFIKMQECMITWENEFSDHGLERIITLKQAKDFGVNL